MAGVDALLEEIDGIPEYLKESKKLMGNVDELQKAPAITIAAKIQTLEAVSLKDATRLKKSLQSLHLTNGDSLKLPGLIDDAGSTSATGKSVGGRTRSAQLSSCT